MLSDTQIVPFKSSHLALLASIQPPEWPDITPYFTFYLNHGFCRSFAVIENKHFIGTGAVIFHLDTAWVAHIVVHPDCRGRGIGRLITKHLIDVAQERNPRSIMLLATPMGEPLYDKMGFRKDTEYAFFREGQSPPPSSPHIRKVTPKDYQQILSIDRKISAEDRSMLLEIHLPAAIVHATGPDVEAVFFPTLTEGLIMSEDTEPGLELMKYKYHHGIQVAILPSLNQPGVALLEKSGAKFFRTASRMYMGEKINWQPTGIFGRIGGYLG